MCVSFFATVQRNVREVFFFSVFLISLLAFEDRFPKKIECCFVDGWMDGWIGVASKSFRKRKSEISISLLFGWIFLSFFLLLLSLILLPL